MFNSNIVTYNTATTPAIAIAAAAKLPTCLGTGAALPVAEDPPALLVAEAPELRDADAPDVAVAVAVAVPEPVRVAVCVAVAV